LNYILCIPPLFFLKKETEGDDSKAVELEDKSHAPVTAAETKEEEQSQCVGDVEGASVSQEAILPAR
jgi:transcription factor TFIIIB component B''